MLITNIKRIVKSALNNFIRSGVVSLSSILVMSITLFMFGTLIFGNVSLKSALNEIKQKVDINVYFITEADEVNILAVKDSLENLPEVSSVEYISREQALLNFKERHVDDQLTLQALEELEDNPLGAILNINAKKTSQYESIANFLNRSNALSSEEVPIIDKINYYQNKIVIDRLTKIISSTEKIGFVLTLILAIMSMIITFNTVRLAIYISRDEISVMRLVGASSKYVQGPFIIEGILYGIISSAITLVIFLPITYYLGSFTDKLFSVNVFNYYMSNFFSVAATIVFSGLFLGAMSSYLAVRKYLKI